MRPSVDGRERELSTKLMRRQAGLSIRVAAVFLVMVLGVPFLNRYQPEISSLPVLGFPASWFLLGLLFYPITWLLSSYFVKASEKMESAEAEMVRSELRGGEGK